ncbi:MAG: metallophosphoesterase [Bacteroidota bacterium]
MEKKITYNHLDALFKHSYEMKVAADSKIVIFSDLHMGDGSSTDDYAPNANTFHQILSHYYKKNFSLILNGDVEELQRFKLSAITHKWRETYKLFDKFASASRFFKTVGNHDMALRLDTSPSSDYILYETLKLKFKKNHFFVFHGHQASKKYQKSNDLIGFTLKYVANPLRIKNYSVSHSSKKQYAIEKKAYEYSRLRKIASIIGHTHRPLFESPMSRIERLKYEIENLCRVYVESGEKIRQKISEEIETKKNKLTKYTAKELLDERKKDTAIYNEAALQVPCLFNSGCVIGKRGITAIEILEGKISLVHWFDDKMERKYIHLNGNKPKQMGKEKLYKMRLNSESLSYIFGRISLLS